MRVEMKLGWRNVSSEYLFTLNVTLLFLNGILQ